MPDVFFNDRDSTERINTLTITTTQNSKTGTQVYFTPPLGVFSSIANRWFLALGGSKIWPSLKDLALGSSKPWLSLASDIGTGVKWKSSVDKEKVYISFYYDCFVR